MGLGTAVRYGADVGGRQRAMKRLSAHATSQLGGRKSDSIEVCTSCIRQSVSVATIQAL